MIEGIKVVFNEIRGGTAGTNYFYVVSNGELIPIRSLAEQEHERFVKKWGNRKEYEIKIDLSEIRRKDIYHFKFHRSGELFASLCRIENREVREVNSLSSERVKRLKFKILGYEREFAEEFKEVVERMREDIGRTENTRHFMLSFHGHPERTREAIEDPDMAYITSMILPLSNSRINSLKNQKMRAVHEIWVMTLIIDALNAEVKEGALGNRELKIGGRQEEPAAILRTHYVTLTLWYQFPRYGPDRHGELLRMCMEGKFEEIGNFLGLEVMPTSGADCESAVKKGNLRPDIVIAKGSFKFANNIKDDTGDIREKAVVIDPKIEIRKSDVGQLKAYTRLFPEGSKFICPCMNCPCMNGVTRSPNGWDVIENVRPGVEGINRFRESLREAVQGICSS